MTSGSRTRNASNSQAELRTTEGNGHPLLSLLLALISMLAAAAPPPRRKGSGRTDPWDLGSRDGGRLSAAHYWASRGKRIVPLYGVVRNRLHGVVRGICECRRGAQCPSPGKHPRIREWQTLATTDRDQIDEWWELWPNSNVGELVGDDEVVADIDPRHDGDKSLARLEA